MRKILSLLIALGFAAGSVYAQDEYEDDEDEYEEEEAPKKASKKAAPKKAKKAADSGPSRMGFAVSFAGGLEPNSIAFVYDMGSGMEFGLGLGLERRQTTPNEGDPQDPWQRAALIPTFSYELGKGLLNYGIGVDLGIILEPAGDNGRPDGGTSIFGVPNFYTNAELVKNVVLKLSAGLRVDMLAEVPNSAPEDQPDNGYKDMNMRFVTQGSIIFYFM